METLTQSERQFKITVNTGQASDILSGLNLFARLHPGEVADRCQHLSDYIWVHAFHALGALKKAA